MQYGCRFRVAAWQWLASQERRMRHGGICATVRGGDGENLVSERPAPGRRGTQLGDRSDAQIPICIPVGQAPVVRLSRGIAQYHEPGVGQLIGAALGDHDPGNRCVQLAACSHPVYPAGLRAQGRVELSDHVVASAEVAQGLTKRRGQFPPRAAVLLGQPHDFQCLEPRDDQAPVLGVKANLPRGADVDPVAFQVPLDHPVHRREALRADLLLRCAMPVVGRAFSEQFRGDFRRAIAHAVGDVLAGDDQVRAVLPPAADDHVRVGVVRVVVVDPHPLELGSQVSLHARHDVAHVGGQVRDVGAALG